MADHVVAELHLEVRHGELDADASSVGLAGTGGATREVLHDNIDPWHQRRLLSLLLPWRGGASACATAKGNQVGFGRDTWDIP